MRERIVARPQADPVALAQAERITIRAAAQASAELADWLDLLRAAQEALPTDSRTQAGMAALAVAGPLTENRKTEILG